MAEQFLTLMADLDEETQRMMSEWYGQLQKKGFDALIIIFVNMKKTSVRRICTGKTGIHFFF